MPTYTTQQIARHVAGALTGPADLVIAGPETLDQAGPGHLSLVGDPRYAAAWDTSRASACLVRKDIPLQPGAGRALIRVDDADLAMALVLDLFAPPATRPPPGVHGTAVVDRTAEVAADARIGAGCWVGARVRIGAGAVLHPRVTVLDDSAIGSGTELWPGVVVRERCTVGARCILHANVVIGSDGFGFRPAPDGRSLRKITHIGTVAVGDDVELGAGTCVDRGKFSATLIGDGTKIDNLVQIGHNCRVGRGCVLSGQSGLAGSVTLGDGVLMGGKAGVRDHVTIGSGARIMGYSAVMDDVPAGQTWGGVPAQERRRALREYLAVKKLPELIDKAEAWLKRTPDED